MVPSSVYNTDKRDNAGHEKTTVNKIAIIHIRTFIQNLFLSKKEKKNAFPCLNLNFTLMFCIRWSKLHQPVFMIKRFEKILPSNLIKEMYNLLSIHWHFIAFEYP